jgi:hypothetical protein
MPETKVEDRFKPTELLAAAALVGVALSVIHDFSYFSVIGGRFSWFMSAHDFLNSSFYWLGTSAVVLGILLGLYPVGKLACAWVWQNIPDSCQARHPENFCANFTIVANALLLILSIAKYFRDQWAVSVLHDNVPILVSIFAIVSIGVAFWLRQDSRRLTFKNFALTVAAFSIFVAASKGFEDGIEDKYEDISVFKALNAGSRCNVTGIDAADLITIRMKKEDENSSAKTTAPKVATDGPFKLLRGYEKGLLVFDYGSSDEGILTFIPLEGVMSVGTYSLPKQSGNASTPRPCIPLVEKAGF